MILDPGGSMALIRTALILPAFICVVASQPLRCQYSKPNEGPIWRWTSLEHAEYLIKTRIEVDGKVVGETAFPACHHKREDKCPYFEPIQYYFDFTLRPKRGREFYGVSKGKMKGYLWQAGDHQDSISFGMGFYAPINFLVFSQVFDVPANQKQTETLAPGIKVSTEWAAK